MSWLEVIIFCVYIVFDTILYLKLVNEVWGLDNKVRKLEEKINGKDEAQ